MTLYIIGIGLCDEKDITIKGLERVKKSSTVYLETYTSKLQIGIERLEKFYGKKIIPADREIVEKRAEETILKDAATKETAFLVIGDPFSATTHIDIYTRAKDAGIKVEIINNASVLTAIGITGLELYKFGKVTSIPFENKNVKTPYEVYQMNQKNGLHTLFLLDLRPEEDKFMTVNEAIDYLISIGLTKETLCIGCAGLGSKEYELKAANTSELLKKRFTKFPQCLIIPGKLHFVEEEMIERYKIS